MAQSCGDDVMSKFSSEFLIEVDNLSLSYRIAHNQSKSLRETLINFAKRESILTHHVALDGISFTLCAGEILAVLGRNGAGKSTLLKCLARALPPTTGRVVTRGTIAPLIELGAGFHPDLTGRENAILYGTILGRSIRTMKSRIDDIAEWSGLGKFIDLPIRTYSSGMLGRLSFAVATDEAPEILMVDEVLSVGDAEFQARSRTRMEKIMRESACMVLVSHNLSLIQELATKAILIENGKITASGDPNIVIKRYESSLEN